MVWHMRNMRSISISIRSIVSSLDVFLLLMLDIGSGELDEFLTSCVHSLVVLLTGLVANSTLDMWPSCIQVGTSCIFNLFILLVMLRGNLWWVLPFLSLFIILLRLSWGGCSLVFFFNLFTSSSSFLTSLFMWSFSLPIASSQDSTSTCSLLECWLWAQRALISRL
jgi:hypothetical protein